MRHMLFAAFLLAPAPLVAEGARLDLVCQTKTICSHDGRCAERTAPRLFSLEPQDIDADGLGAYTVSHDAGVETEAQGLTRLGPFLWLNDDGLRMTLTLTTEHTAVLVRQVPNDQRPSAEIDILECEVTF
ncbi:hypothetical protein OB2597_02497 [Pseudooceanicola batsensis HTCC2597]|uniref:Uncharacterized protein n=1 Tax=Pseudooceanicola batsensis (strain ATCC BAA-863 / DSM 15984 / KCTC 12145 / HTCC2597) TaxID=252305 RepID=A3TX93_PSEBH|nr:hypothetical protein [Pseudooceanicola batsensis]EAQ03453.1 hypothetical protein OB2597_02497 [Pseudooceanicola batsensis HTCC2597]